MRLERAPAQHKAPGPDDDPVGEEAEQPHREHRRNADVHPADVVGVPQHVAEAGLHRDHLGDDHRRPGDADAEAQAGEDRGQCRRKNHLGEDGDHAGAEHARGAQQQQIGIAHAVRGVHHDRVESAEADEKERACVVDAEHRDGEGKPRRDRNRAQQLHGRIDQARREPAPADHQPERNRHQCGKAETLQHAAASNTRHCRATCPSRARASPCCCRRSRCTRSAGPAPGTG